MLNSFPLKDHDVPVVNRRNVQWLLFVKLLSTRLVIVSLDATLWPAKAALLSSALQILGTVVSMSSANVGHIQLPVGHQAMKPETTIKHGRQLEDALLNMKLDMTNPVTLIFKKDEARGSDKRRLVQRSFAAISSHFKGSDGCIWLKSNAIQSGYIDNLPLIKVTEMIGYDEIAKPSPGARVEQSLAKMKQLFFVVL